MRGWEPGFREFDNAMSADPLAFVAERLSDLNGLMAGAGVDPAEGTERDAEELRTAVPEILATVRNLLAGVREGRLAPEPDADEPTESARIGWL